MMDGAKGNLHMLAGGLRVKPRVQHPLVKPRKDRPGWPWVFLFRSDEVKPDGMQHQNPPEIPGSWTEQG
jgi:hypothetical protein